MEKCYLEKNMMFRLYIKDKLEKGNIVKLNGELAFRIISVLRLRKEDKLILFNGSGGEYKSVILNITKGCLDIKIEDFRNICREKEIEVHLLQGISRKDRMQYSIQKSCELGVKTITPIFSEKCNVKISENKIQERVQHWKNIAISASEQSGRCFTTDIKEPISFSSALRFIPKNTFMGYPKSKITLKDCNIKLKNGICLIIGPEKGFSDKEYKMAIDSGVRLFSMGSRLLRSGTASVVGLSVLEAI